MAKDRRELDRDRDHLEARDATITARENTWTRHRNQAVALGAFPAVVLTTIVHALV